MSLRYNSLRAGYIILDGQVHESTEVYGAHGGQDMEKLR